MIKKLFSTVLISLLCGGILFSSSVIAELSYKVMTDSSLETYILYPNNSPSLHESDISFLCFNKSTQETIVPIITGTNFGDNYKGYKISTNNIAGNIGIECNVKISNIAQRSISELKIKNSQGEGLQYNDSITTMDIVFSGDNSTLQILDFSDSGIIGFFKNTFKDLKLKTLNLSYNRIQSITEGLFTYENVKHLKSLNLSNNKVERLNKSFVSCDLEGTDVETLDINLSDNEITSISGDVFGNLSPDRCTINLQGNKLSNIPDAFSKKKVVLGISDNPSTRKTIGNGREVNLKDNPIVFLNIIEPTSNSDIIEINSCRQTFKRIGYDHHTNLNPNFSYNLRQGNKTLTGNTTYNEEVTISGLKSGSYVFEIAQGSKNTSIYLNVDLGDLLTLNTPDINNDYASFSWNGSYNCGISGYTISIDSGSEISVGSGTSYSTGNLSDGSHIFTVKMYGTDNELIDEKSLDFTINTTPSSDIKVTITAPTQEQTVTSSSTVFSREGQVSQPNSLGQAGNQYTITGYDWKLYKGHNTDTNPISSGNVSTTDTTYSMNYNGLTNGKYTLEVDMNFCKGNANTQCSATKDKSFFYVQLSTGDANVFITKPTTDQIVTSKTQEFTRSGNAGSNYQLSGYIYLLTQDGATITGGHTKTNTSITLDELEHGKEYTFTVDMYAKEDNMKIASDTKEFSVNLKNNTYLTITSPSSGASLSSSSTTFNWSVYNDTITNPVYSYTLSGPTTYSGTTTATSLNYNGLKNGNYTLNVNMLSGNNIVAEDSVSFTVSIKSSGGWSGGGGGGSSGKSHKTNEIQLSTDTPNPSKNQGVNLTIKTNDYTGKLTFSAKYRPDTSSSRTDISNNTSSNYYGNYSNIWEEGYYTMKSSDDGEKKLKNLVEFQKEGYYRIYVTDDQGTTSYTEFHIGNTDEERYIARSCKKYKLTYNNSLSVRTSPNLNKNEYFVNTDYFKRYIDSKNAQIDGCPTNDPRISNTYQDTTNRDDKYTAPNGKVYFINNKNGKYQSDELDYPSKLFNTLSEIKYYIRDRNPFIGMARTK